MEDVRFDRPVRILTGPVFSVSRQVQTMAEAAGYLLEGWPKGAAGRKHLAARRACIAGLQGKKQPKAVREAFEAAADEAHILVIPP